MNRTNVKELAKYLSDNLAIDRETVENNIYKFYDIKATTTTTNIKRKKIKNDDVPMTTMTVEERKLNVDCNDITDLQKEQQREDEVCNFVNTSSDGNSIKQKINNTTIINNDKNDAVTNTKALIGINNECELNMLKVKDLREICVANNLNSKGVKGKLIAEILAFDSSILKEADMKGQDQPRCLSIKDKKCCRKRKCDDGENVPRTTTINNDDTLMTVNKKNKSQCHKQKTNVKKRSDEFIKNHFMSCNADNHHESDRECIYLDKNRVDKKYRFKFNDDRVVVGKMVKVNDDDDDDCSSGEKLVALNLDDIKLCKEKNLQYIIPDNIQ